MMKDNITFQDILLPDIYRCHKKPKMYNQIHIYSIEKDVRESVHRRCRSALKLNASLKSSQYSFSIS